MKIIRQTIPSLLFSLSALLAFTACSDDSGSGATGASKVNLQVQVYDELPNCSKNRNGEIAEIISEHKAYLCDNGRWEFDHVVLDSVWTDDDLPACLTKNEGDSVWVVRESAVFACIDRKWEKHAKEEPAPTPVVEEPAAPAILTYKSEDDLPNCTKDRNGVFAMVNTDVVRCEDGRWENLGRAYASELDLPNCTSKREGEKVFIVEEGISLVCSDKRWVDPREIVKSSFSENIASSDAKKKTSSSSSKIADSGTESGVTSSSKKESASSSSKTVESSSGGKSSSSKKVESSSSVATILSGGGSCAPEKAIVEQGEKVVWIYTNASPVSATDLLKAKFKWSLPGASPDSIEITGLSGRSNAVSYATSGQKTASLVISTTNGDFNIVCDPVQINEAKPLSSSVQASSSSAKVSSSSSSQTVVTSQYDCSVYKCVSTESLNQDMLKAGKYGEFLDTRDNQVYRTIQIGRQVWMAQNLNYASVAGNADYGKGSFCYKNDTTYCPKYGKIYSWTAVSNVPSTYKTATFVSEKLNETKYQGICPAGFHVPQIAEMDTLLKCVKAANSTDRSALTSAVMWPSKNGKNSLGFSLLPGGWFTDYGSYVEGDKQTRLWLALDSKNKSAYIWGCGDKDCAYDFNMNYQNYKFYVRCIKD